MAPTAQSTFPAVLKADQPGGFGQSSLRLLVRDTEGFLSLPVPEGSEFFAMEDVLDYVIAPGLTVRVTAPERGIVRFTAYGDAAIQQLKEVIAPGDQPSVKELYEALNKDHQVANAEMYESERIDPDPAGATATVRFELYRIGDQRPLTFLSLRALVDSATQRDDYDPHLAWRKARFI